MINPEIEAELSIKQESESPKAKGISDKLGYYGCPLFFSGGGYDCRMTFPSSKGNEIPLGSNCTALIQFLSPEMILPLLEEGSKFELWESGIFAEGVVTKIIK